MPIKIKNEAGEEVEVLTAAEQTEMVTGAVKSHMDKATKKLSTDLTASLGETLTKAFGDYETKRAEKAAEEEEARKAQAATTQTDAGKGAGVTAADIENSPAFRTIQKKLDAALKAQKEADDKAKAEASKVKDTTLRQKLSEELDKNGFDPKARHLVLSHLVDGAKLARYADDGESIVFRDTDGSDVDLPTGLKSFAQTDDGKRFMAASGASGTGDRTRFTPPAQSKDGKLQPGVLGRMVLQAVDGAPQPPNT